MYEFLLDLTKSLGFIESMVISADEAIRLILENTRVLEPIEVSPPEAIGRVLAEGIISPLNLPIFTNSAMDGYAVKSRDTEGAIESSPVYLKVIDVVRAGNVPDFVLRDGEAAKVMTGAPVPDGADAVVMVEYTDEVDGSVKIKRAVNPDENIRREGEEVMKGEIALECGVSLNAASIGFLAELGMRKIKVYRKPNIALVVTGDELTGLDEELSPGKIRDTNSIALKTALLLEAVELSFAGRARDDVSIIEEKLKEALDRCDVLLVTGGVSAGDYDHVRSVFKKLNIETIFWKVAQKPGGPLFFGKKNDTLVFGLPGNPASSLVSFYEYARPALHKMIGKKDMFLLEIEAVLLDEIRKKAGKIEFQRGYLENRGGSFCVKPIGNQGSHVLKSFALCNCLIVVPEEATHISANERVKVHVLP